MKQELLGKVFWNPENDLFSFFKVVPTIIFVAVLVNILYHIGLMQRVVAVMAKGMKWLTE